MKIIFLGTPEFSIPTLKAIYESKHELIAIISQPDRVQDRGRKIVFSPVKEFALAHNIPIYQFEKLSRDGVERIKELNPDIMVTASFGQIISQEIIDTPKYGIINVHASLLPDLRGASPIQTAIMRGYKKTGITIMQTEAGLDTGDIILTGELNIGENETYGELSVRLAQLGAGLLMTALDKIEDGNAEYIKQSHVDATITRRISKEEGRIVWDKSAYQLKCQILGQNPSPIAYTFLNDVCVKIYRAKIAVSEDVKETNEPVGSIIEPTSAKRGLFVQCGKGVLEIEQVQFPGGKVLKGTEAINGRKIKLGDCFVYNGEIQQNNAVKLNVSGNKTELNNSTKLKD